MGRQMDEPVRSESAHRSWRRAVTASDGVVVVQENPLPDSEPEATFILPYFGTK